MNVTQKWLLGTGVLLLVATNAVALIGVAYNRMDPPEAVLTLTERELGAQSYWMWPESENSGLNVKLQIRTERVTDMRPGEIEDWASLAPFGGGLGSAVRWLDQEKLASLGFDVNLAPNAPDAERHYDRMLERYVLLVLELDGPARARALQTAHDRVTQLAQKAAEGSDDTSTSRQLKNAREALQYEEEDASRLFIIDAGLDEDSLRQRYPDRARYAIVRGTVRPMTMSGNASAKLYGRVTGVHCESINVPLQFHASVKEARLPRVSAAARTRFVKSQLSMTVAFGRRLEPWILSARSGGT